MVDPVLRQIGSSCTASFVSTVHIIQQDPTTTDLIRQKISEIVGYSVGDLNTAAQRSRLTSKFELYLLKGYEDPSIVSIRPQHRATRVRERRDGANLRDEDEVGLDQQQEEANYGNQSSYYLIMDIMRRTTHHKIGDKEVMKGRKIIR
ncbi:hypothetical protein P3L10_018760 [Capsicum annuum]